MWDWGQKLTAKGRKECFWDDGTISYFDGAFKAVCAVKTRRTCAEEREFYCVFVVPQSAGGSGTRSRAEEAGCFFQFENVKKPLKSPIPLTPRLRTRGVPSAVNVGDLTAPQEDGYRRTGVRKHILRVFC